MVIVWLWSDVTTVSVLVPSVRLMAAATASSKARVSVSASLAWLVWWAWSIRPPERHKMEQISFFKKFSFHGECGRIIKMTLLWISKSLTMHRNSTHEG